MVSNLQRNDPEVRGAFTDASEDVMVLKANRNPEGSKELFLGTFMGRFTRGDVKPNSLFIKIPLLLRLCNSRLDN